MLAAATLGLSGCGGGSDDKAAPDASSARPAASATASSASSASRAPSPTATCVRGDKTWLDANLLGRSVTGYLPIEFGGPPKLCAPVTVYVGYFDVTFRSGRGGGKPEHGYTVETVDRQRFTVDGTATVTAEPPSAGDTSGSCTARLMVMSLGKRVGPADIKTISWSQYEANGAIGNVGIAFKDNERIARYDLQTPSEAPAC